MSSEQLVDLFLGIVVIGGFVGVAGHLRGFLDTRQDLRYHERIQGATGRNGGSRLVLEGNLRNEVIRLAVKSVLLIVSFVAILTPPAWRMIVMAFGLMVVVILLDISSYCDRLQQNRVRIELQAEMAKSEEKT